MWFSVYLQRVLQSDIHVASYSYDAENEEWCEVSLQVIVVENLVDVPLGKANELLAYTGRCLRQETLWLLASETKEKTHYRSVLICPPLIHIPLRLLYLKR